MRRVFAVISFKEDFLPGQGGSLPPIFLPPVGGYLVPVSPDMARLKASQKIRTKVRRGLFGKLRTHLSYQSNFEMEELKIRIAK